MDFPDTKELLATLQQPNQQSQVEQSFPWLPTSTESSTDYMAFEMWRNLGAKRPKQAHSLARQNSWEQRALAYDAWLAAQSSDVQKVATDISSTLLRGCEGLVQALQVELVKTLRGLGNSSAPSMSLPELTKALETVTKTVRLLQDKSTENVSVHVGIHDMSALSQDELDMAESLVQKTLTCRSQ